MNAFFEQSKAMFTTEMNWYTAQVTQAGEALAAETKKLTRSSQDNWNALLDRQSGLMGEYTRHATELAGKQMELWRGVFGTESA